VIESPDELPEDMADAAAAGRLAAWRQAAFDRGGLLALAVLVTYVWLAPAHIVDGDNAEFSTLGTIGGVAHPTGYPLYLLWLRATAWLPGHSAAHTASIATAMLGAACAVVLHAACRAWGARAAAATIAAALFAASPIVLRMSTEAEAFALNDLIAATILWLAARRGPLRGVWRAGALGLAAGLGLSDHVTCVLLAPVGMLGVVRGAREAKRAWQAIALAAAGLAIGLLPYAYLAITAENPLSWGQHIDSVRAIAHHFLREDYGGPGAFAPDPAAAPVSQTLFELGKMLARTWLYVPFALALVVLAKRCAQKATERAAWCALAASFLLAGPILVTRFDVELAGPGLILVQRFFMLPALILAIPTAIALDRVERVRFAHGIGVALFLALAAAALPYVQGTHSRAVEAGVENMLRSLPEGAVAIVHDDDLDFGSGYVQLVLGERTDVTVVMWSAMGLPAYRERVERRLGLRAARERPLAFAGAVLASGRALFVDPYQQRILDELPNYPHGILFRVLPPNTARPSPAEVMALNKQLLSTFDLHYPLPSPSDDWPAHIHERYVRMWQIIRDDLAAAGDKANADLADQTAYQLLPR
jgi:hypothetical protein